MVDEPKELTKPVPIIDASQLPSQDATTHFDKTQRSAVAPVKTVDPAALAAAKERARKAREAYALLEKQEREAYQRRTRSNGVSTTPPPPPTQQQTVLAGVPPSSNSQGGLGIAGAISGETQAITHEVGATVRQFGSTRLIGWSSRDVKTALATTKLRTTYAETNWDAHAEMWEIALLILAVGGVGWLLGGKGGVAQAAESNVGGFASNLGTVLFNPNLKFIGSELQSAGRQ